VGSSLRGGESSFAVWPRLIETVLERKEKKGVNSKSPAGKKKKE